MYRPVKDWSGRPRKVNGSGYPIVWVPEHPKSFEGGWYYEHRLVVEASEGRVIDSDETIHHISEDKMCCKIENLFVCDRVEHDNAVWLTG